MAVNDPYGLAASGLPPDLIAQLSGLTREQQVAQAMMQQGMSPIETPDVKGRFQGRAGFLQPLSKLLQAYVGSTKLNESDSKYSDIASEAIKRRAQALQDYQQARDGTPATPSVPYSDTLGSEAPQANIPGTPAKPGNARQAIMQAMLNPMLQGNPIVGADLKKMEPAWTPTKQYNPTTGREEMVLVNKNDPTQVMPMGGQKAADLQRVTVAGPDGRPQTSFVDPHAVAGPLAQPVKKEMVNTGGSVVPVDPYAPTALDKTVTPDALLHRKTSLEVAGLGADGLPTGDVKEVAQMIADGKMPPLSSFAMARPRGQAIMAEVAKINPNYSAIDYHVSEKSAKDFATGKQGNTVRSFNVGLAHLDTLGQLAEAMNNGDVQLANKVSNTVAAQTGSSAPTNFEAAKQIVAKEVVKAIVGSGGGVGEREAAEKTISASSSPAQLRGVINTYKQLFQGQLGGLKQQYEQSTGRKDFDRFLSSEGKGVAHGTSNVIKFDSNGNQLP